MTRGSKNAGLFALLGFTVLFVYQVIGVARSFMAYHSNSRWLDSTAATSTPPLACNKREGRNSKMAQEIVQKAYESTYIIFDEVCPTSAG